MKGWNPCREHRCSCPESSTRRFPASLQQTRNTAEREHLLRALDASGWNVSAAARTLGMERTNLHKRIRALGLKR
jgi:two-component system, NtrC family, nitrogen regulation response regulator NtrX